MSSLKTVWSSVTCWTPPARSEVDAAVADVGDEAARAEDEERAERRAHAALLGVGLGLLVDAGARALHRVLHEREDVLVA